ncbi:hypothetical protein SDC9_126511 [bioreactor metagenome]|uniref:Uncharacterized protein n=1 Tax=bioreactor metagenome TaxID=1076179 RepID=A0A645CRF5_9ZZZZ
MGVPVKVGQGQLLQLVKEVSPQPVYPLLRQSDHHGGLTIGCRRAEQKNNQQLYEVHTQLADRGISPVKQIVDDDPAGKIGAGQVAKGGECQTQAHGNQQQLVVSEVAQQALNGLPGFLRLLKAAPGRGPGPASARPHLHGLAISCFRHYSRTPSC